MIDLHIHTTASDGSHPASEVVEMARSHHLLAFGVADHNSTGSLQEAYSLAEKYRLNFFPAVELDTLYQDQDLHLLVYGIDFQNQECRDWMDWIEKAKMDQTKRRVEKLKGLGFRIEYQELVGITKGKMPTGGDYVRALSIDPEGRNDPRVREYIDGARSDSPYLNFYLDWLKAGKKGFVPFEEMDCVKVIEKAGKLKGVAVLAHPSDAPEEYVRELKGRGLQGLEVYTSYHSPDLAKHWLGVAREAGLMITAGSDFHGKPIKPKVKFGIDCPEEQEIIERLTQAMDSSRGIYLFFPKPSAAF